MKVVKFGGSSLAEASGFRKVKTIVQQDVSRLVVVVSAPGKNKIYDAKVTDLLYLLYAHIEYGIDYESILMRIKNRFISIRNELKLTFDLESEFLHLESLLNKNISKDFLVSRGEYFQAKLMAEYLGYAFIDSKDLIVLKQNGKVSISQTKSKLNFDVSSGVVIPGFYGSSTMNNIKLFSRGGSDLTGAIVSAYLGADEYEKWTDVSGIFAADPNIVTSAESIPEITFGELREMSYRGASVLHEEVLIPLENMSITISIKNTNDLMAVGTKIKREISQSGRYMTSVTGKQDFIALNISKRSSSDKITVLRDVLSLFINYRVNIEHIPSGIDTFSVIFDASSIKDELDELLESVNDIKNVTEVTLERNISLVAVVGRNMASIPGIAGKLFTCLGLEDINVKTIAQASTELSIIIGVENDDYEKTIRTIHKRFFEQ